MGKKITWGSSRELNKYDIDISQYYKNLTEHWNKLSNHISEPTDRRTNYYYAYHQFFDDLLYMWDMIRQTQQQYETLISNKNEQIKALEKQLDKWTNQQKGKKPILTEEQKEQILNYKWDGLSNREIARRLEVSEGTIRNFLKGF